MQVTNKHEVKCKCKPPVNYHMGYFGCIAFVPLQISTELLSAEPILTAIFFSLPEKYKNQES